MKRVTGLNRAQPDRLFNTFSYPSVQTGNRERGEDRIRTGCLLFARQALYQMSYIPSDITGVVASTTPVIPVSYQYDQAAP